jgi:hypothetical protein
LVKFKVMFSVPQNSWISRVFQFFVVVLRHLFLFCGVRRPEPSWWISTAPSFFLFVSVVVWIPVVTLFLFAAIFVIPHFFALSVLLLISHW